MLWFDTANLDLSSVEYCKEPRNRALGHEKSRNIKKRPCCYYAMRDHQRPSTAMPPALSLRLYIFSRAYLAAIFDDPVGAGMENSAPEMVYLSTSVPSRILLLMLTWWLLQGLYKKAHAVRLPWKLDSARLQRCTCVPTELWIIWSIRLSKFQLLQVSRIA